MQVTAQKARPAMYIMYVSIICHIPIQWENYDLGNSHSWLKISIYLSTLIRDDSSRPSFLFLKIKERYLADACRHLGKGQIPSLNLLMAVVSQGGTVWKLIPSLTSGLFP